MQTFSDEPSPNRTPHYSYMKRFREIGSLLVFCNRLRRRRMLTVEKLANLALDWRHLHEKHWLDLQFDWMCLHHQHEM